jgi:hypothetical protein
MDESRIEKARLVTTNWGQGYWDPGLMTEDFVMEQHGGTMEGVYAGQQGAQAYREGFEEVWVEASVDVDDLLEQDGRIVALTRLKVKGRGSGIEVEIAGAGVVSFAEDGRVWRIDAYTDRDAALESVGLGPG